MLKKIKQKRGFTLVELLAVIVVLGVVMAIAVPATTKYIQNSKEAAFYTNVRGIVDNIKNNTDLVEANACIYVWSEETYDPEISITSDIREISVVSFLNEEGDKKFAVTATASNSDASINTLDFYSTSLEDKNDWSPSEEDGEDLGNKFLEIASKASNNGTCKFASFEEGE